VTSRLLDPATSADQADYDTLVAEALDAFGRDVMYAVQVVESARSLAKRKTKTNRRQCAV
jgi:hypothetical protein